MTATMSPESRERLLDMPAAAPPPGVVPDFDHPWSLEWHAEVTLHCLYSLATVLFFTKVFVQLRIVRKLTVEDYVLAVAWLVYTGAFQPTGTMFARAKLGIHQWEIKVGDLARHLFLQYCALIIWGVVMLLLKVVILLQYLRVFVPRGTRNFTFWTAHALMYLNIVYYVAFIFLQMFSCNPMEKYWDKTITGGYCMDIYAVNVSGAVVCLVSDLAIFLLPQRVIYGLNLSLARRIGLGFLFAIGLFACVTSAVRLYYNVRIWQMQTDTTYQLGYILMWGTAQIPAGFLIVCLPSAAQLTRHIRMTRWCVRFEEAIREKLNISSKRTQNTRTPVVGTFGGGGGGGGIGRKINPTASVISDIEFRELMAEDAEDLRIRSQDHRNSTQT
ncbi:hypothetical protein GGS20DRAFT_555431 [Poronia punctata]|nr:hypothetical protein GGS20DRAFT_555431 [Poronia punctata]